MVVVYRDSQKIRYLGGLLHLEINFTTGDSWTVFTPFSDLDMAGAPSLRQAAVCQVSEGRNQLVLDLSAVTFIDSSGLGAIIGALRRTRTHDGDLVLVAAGPEPRRAFELCDLDRDFEFHADLDSAVGQPGPVSP